MKRYLIVAAAAFLLTGCAGEGESSVAQGTETTLGTVLLSGAATTTTTTTTAPVEGAVLPGATTAATETDDTDSVDSTVATAPTISTPATLPVEQVDPFSAADLQIVCNGVTLKPELDINTVLSSLGTPDSQLSAPSCNYDGDDKVFVFGDVTIYTYPAGSADKILEIEVGGSTVSTSRGVTVGMTQDEITALYGADCTTEGSTIRYSDGGSYLWFFLQNGTITSFGVTSE